MPTADVAGKKFRAYLQYGIRAQVHELTLLPLRPHWVLVRTQAALCCYTVCMQALGSTQEEYDRMQAMYRDGAGRGRILGHGGVGIVEAVAPDVKRVQPGDQVVVPVNGQCGQCYNCLRSRADHCVFRGNPIRGETNAYPVATLSDGTPVIQHLNVGGFAEYMITPEEDCVPVVTKVPATELTLLNCAGTVGLGATMTKAKVTPGSDVVVIGCGPLGLSAVQGARIMGAGQVIAVDPVRERREVALRTGATTALDPNVEPENLVAKIRQLCPGKTSRVFAGGGSTGPDFVVEAVGGDLYPPKEPGFDTTGLSALHQAWDVVSPVGDVVTTGFNVVGDFAIPAAEFSNAKKNHHPGNYGGANPMRDVPQFVRLIETGQFNAKALVTAVHPLEETREAYQKVADRTTVAAVIAFD